GPSIAWPTVGTSGISFAYIRAGEGSSQPDDDFQKNWTGAKAAGITAGAYLFFHPSQDPVAQAGLLVHQLQLVAFIHGDLVPVIDVETTDNQSPTVITANLQKVVDSVRSAIGATPGIYTSPVWWDQHVGSSAFSTSPLWVAQWCGCASPSVR